MADAIDLFTREARDNRKDVSVPVDTAQIEIIERLLERAKAGELQGFAYVARTNQDSSITAWTRTMFDDPFMYLGLLESVKHEIHMTVDAMNNAADEDTEDEE